MQTIPLEKWRNIHVDYKGYVEGRPYILQNINGATAFVPVEIDRSKPATITPDKFIGAWTAGLMEEPSETREAIEIEFNKAVKDHEDYFYSIEIAGRKFFVVKNDLFGYTAMLPEDY